jgi:hypothetical protein
MHRLPRTNRRRITSPSPSPRKRRCTHHGLIANQIASATIAKTTMPHATGVARFELPLRGESLAARLNFLSMGTTNGRPPAPCPTATAPPGRHRV